MISQVLKDYEGALMIFFLRDTAMTAIIIEVFTYSVQHTDYTLK